MRKKDVLLWSAVALLTVLGFVLHRLVLALSFSGLVCYCLAGLIAGLKLLAILVKKFGKPARTVRRVILVILCIGFLILGITEGMIIHASFGDPEEHCDYILVLGCMVRPDGPSPSLQNRIDAAFDYLTAHPDVIAVVSGGQGADEPMTEARCMYEHLVQMGIDPARVWMEEEATSTWGNLHYALELIEKNSGTRPQKLGIVSSEYHMFRASLFAREFGVEPVGIPARSTDIPQAINHFMREVAGVWHYIILGGQYD